jgi:mRNA interferase RelE/StbE
VKVAFRESFAKDLKRIKDKPLLRRVKEIIEAIELADTAVQIPNLKKLKGHQNYFRLRLGDHRLGIVIENDSVIFVRFLDRKDIYKYFP